MLLMPLHVCNLKIEIDAPDGQGFKNRHSPENQIGQVVSLKIDKTGTKFKSANFLN
jgi:hypothetical protein